MVDIRLSQDPHPERAPAAQPKVQEAPKPVEPPPPEPLIDERREGPRGPVEPPRKDRERRMWWIAAIVAAIIAGLLLASSVWTVGDAKDEDKLGDAKVDVAKLAPEKQCAQQGTYDLIKRELFRRAAQTRGSDAAAFAKLSDYALLRVQSPILRGVDEDVGRISCNGTAVLQLPPGVKVSDGSSTLSSVIDYAVQPSADRTGNVVMLGNAEAITVPLATIGRSASRPAEPLVIPDMDPVAGGAPIALPQPAQPAEPVVQPSPQQPVQEPEAPEVGSARPSFNCANARTRGEIAVCRDSGLAALDRQMASQFYSALRNADARQRALLQSTRGGFLAFRDRCRSDACIADTYRGRIREISDIMAGRWNPGR